MAVADLDSIVKRLIAQESGGVLSRAFHLTIGLATTAANTTSGYITAQRFPLVFPFPSLTGYTGWEPSVEAITEDAGVLMACIEYDLGALTMSTNTFAAGTDSIMGARTTRINGTTYSARQTASMIPMLVASSTLTATTPVITITYQNQAGTGSRTCSMTLPTNAVINSAFCMTPHLNSGDTGLEDVTNMSRSAGTLGELRVKGCIPIAFSCQGVGTSMSSFTEMHKPKAPFLAESGDKLAFYFLGGATTKDLDASIFGRPI